MALERYTNNISEVNIFEKKLNRKVFLGLIFSFTIVTGFLFFGIEKAQAGWCAYKDTDNKGKFTSATKEQCGASGLCSGAQTSCTYFENETDAKNQADSWAQTQTDFNNRTESAGKDITKKAVELATSPLLWVFNTLLYGVFLFMSLLLFIATSLMDWVINPTNFQMVVSNNTALFTFWTMVRDILNIAFILVLLFSAFCTIFQVAKYNYKKILLTLIIMALLVNFSYPIARVIIDASNVMFYSIVAKVFPDVGNKTGLGATITSTTNIAGIVAPNTSAGEFFGSPSTLTVKLLLAIIFMFIFAVTLLIIAIMLVIRMVVLAILIIFSPVGFVGNIFPGFQKYADSWWDELFKQSFFAPIMIFMVYLAVEMMKVMNQSDSLKKTIESAAGKSINVNATDYSSLIVTGATLAIPLTILWTGMIVAKKMGGAGADFATKWGKDKVQSGLTSLAKVGWHKFDRDVLAHPKVNLSPRGWIQGWKERTAEKETDKIGYAKAHAKDKLGSIFEPGRRDPNFYRDAKDAELKAKYKKEQEAVSSQDRYAISEIQKLSGGEDAGPNGGKTDKESQLRAQAWFMTMSDNKDLNEWMKLRNKNVDPYDLKKDLVKEFRKLGMTEEAIAKALFHLGNNSFMQGDYAKGGMAGKDKDGKWKIHSDEEQKAWVLGKIKNIPTQKLMIDMHPGSLVVERGELLKKGQVDARGNVLMEDETEEKNNRGEAMYLHDIGKGIAEHLNSIGAPHINRLRGDSLSKINSLNSGDTTKEANHFRDLHFNRLADALDDVFKKQKQNEKQNNGKEKKVRAEDIPEEGMDY